MLGGLEQGGSSWVERGQARARLLGPLPHPQGTWQVLLLAPSSLQFLLHSPISLDLRGRLGSQLGLGVRGCPVVAHLEAQVRAGKHPPVLAPDRWGGSAGRGQEPGSEVRQPLPSGRLQAGKTCSLQGQRVDECQPLGLS